LDIQLVLGHPNEAKRDKIFSEFFQQN